MNDKQDNKGLNPVPEPEFGKPELVIKPKKDADNG